MSDSKDFLKDVGLEWTKEQLLKVAKENIVLSNNIYSFVSPHSDRMDDPRTATYKHVKNLINTYGIDVLMEAIDMVITNE